jgi:hypothetical protein
LSGSNENFSLITTYIYNIANKNNRMYHAVGTDPKSNMKIVERDARWIHEKHKSQLGDPTAASSPKE